MNKKIMAISMILLLAFTGCSKENAGDGTASESPAPTETIETAETPEAAESPEAVESSAPPSAIATPEADKDVGFRTAEELMTYFTGCVAQGDLEGACEAFAINLMAENYSLEEMMASKQAWDPTYQMPYPSEDDSYLQVNKALLRADAMEQIADLCMSLYTDEAYLQKSAVPVEEGESAAVSKSLKLKNMTSFKMTEMDYASPDDQDSEENQAAVMVKNKIYGSDDFAEFAVNYSCGRYTYSGSVTLIQYDKMWYFFSLHSTLEGDSAPSSCYLEKLS